MVLPTLDGLTSFEKDLCRRLARHGIVGISLDFYRNGDTPLDSYNELSDSRAMTDLDEVYEFISSEDVEWAIDGNIGMFGADVGGRFVLMAASRRDWVSSAAIAYAPLTGDEARDFQAADTLDNLPIPILALYGNSDELIDNGSVDEAQRRNDHGQWLLYEGVGHGFLDAEDDNFDPSAADDALARILAFFQATLAPAVVEDLG